MIHYIFLLKQKKKRNKTKEKRKELVVQEARCINKTKKRKPIPSLSQLSHLFHSLRPCAFIQPDLHTFTLHAIRVSANLSLSLSLEHGSWQSQSRCPSLHGHHHHRRHLQRRCCSRSRLSHQHWYFSFFNFPLCLASEKISYFLVFFPQLQTLI